MLAKRISLAAAAVLVSLLLLEVGTRLLHRVRLGEPFPVSDLRESLAAAPEGDRAIVAPPRLQADRRFLSGKVLHPYLGYVHDRRGGRDAARPVNRFGFFGLDPLTPAEPDVVRVAITGGSVALQLYDEGGETLADRLAASPALAGRRVELVALTLGGYKQPQQLMALAWLLSLGARFDVVINLDGFNEVVLPMADNQPVGVHPSFPRSWHFYQAKALDPARVAHAAETLRLREKQQALRRSIGTGLLSHSAFALTVLSWMDASIAEELAAHDAAWQSGLGRTGLSFQATGPFVPYASDAALYRELVSLWRRSSLEMHQLATGAGGLYVHFLQPNQWVKGAKPLSGIERSQLRVEGPFTPRVAVPAAYPLLERAGQELAERGVAFQSLVQLFGEEPRTVYRDTCCHFNELGIRQIAEEVARAVSEKLQNRR